jgi:hypothetical protein
MKSPLDLFRSRQMLVAGTPGFAGRSYHGITGIDRRRQVLQCRDHDKAYCPIAVAREELVCTTPVRL